MSTVLWENALQGVTPAKGGAALPPATYRLKAVAGEGKETRGGGIALEVQFEVQSGPLQGRKQFHNENLPSGSTDNDKTRMAFFLGLMDVYGITGAQLGQMFAGQPITVQTVDYIAKHLVSTGKVIRGTARPQKNDPSRINLVNWTADEGPEPAPPAQGGASAPAGGAPGPFGGGAPQGAPGGFPGGMPGGTPGAPPNTMPLGGFPGSGGTQPNAAPEWANAPAAAQQGQAPQTFTTPAVNQQPQYPAQDQGFPGQQFPGQVNPAQFPAQGQPQQFQQADPAQGGFAPQQGAPGQQMPGIPQAQPPGQFGGQPQGAPGLPTGGFPQTGAPQASF